MFYILILVLKFVYDYNMFIIITSDYRVLKAHEKFNIICPCFNKIELQLTCLFFINKYTTDYRVHLSINTLLQYNYIMKFCKGT